MSKKTEIPLQLRRRTHLLDRVIDNLLPNMYPCDYNSSDHFVEGALDEIRWFLVDVEELQGIERTDIENYILDYKYDELTEYFNERCIVLKNDNLKESIRRILREESNIPKVIARRVTLDELDKIFERSLDVNTEDYENPLTIMYGRSYKAFAKVVIDDMIVELQGELGIPYLDDEDEYNEKYREPLLRHYAPIIKDRYMDITSNSVDESVLKEESNPVSRRIFRRADPKKLDKIFVDGLGIMTARYLQNQHNWHAMTFNKFKQAIVSYLIVDVCTKYVDICYGNGDFYDQVWDFLWNYYSDRIEERWEEIKPK